MEQAELTTLREQVRVLREACKIADPLVGSLESLPEHAAAARSLMRVLRAALKATEETR